MKRVWKPLDVGGLRLYEVFLDWTLKGEQRNRRKRCIVAATAPRHAAQLIEKIYKESYDNNPRIAYWSVTGHALNILMPKEWDEEGAPCPECEPKRFKEQGYRLS